MVALNSYESRMVVAITIAARMRLDVMNDVSKGGIRQSCSVMLPMIPPLLFVVLCMCGTSQPVYIVCKSVQECTNVNTIAPRRTLRRILTLILMKINDMAT